MKTKGKSCEIDIHIGGKIRHFRIVRDMTQKELAARSRVTFQQIQKYENATNRVSASRLWEIAGIQQQDIISYFPERSSHD